MDGRTGALGALRSSVVFWSDFIARCVAQRLETDRFESYVRLVHEKQPLPAAVIADLFLRPQPSNHDSLDPRVPPYVQILTRLGYVDTPAVAGGRCTSTRRRIQRCSSRRRPSKMRTETGRRSRRGTRARRERR